MKRIFAIVNIGLLTAMSFFGVNAFYKGLAARLDVVPVVGPEAGTEVDRDETRSLPIAYYTPIVERDLFKTSKEAAELAPETAAVDLNELEQTALKLKLWGTVSGDKSSASAVIEDLQARKQNLYREGDAIQNATIKMILREKVVLTVDGKDEVLEMEKLLASAGPGGAVPQPSEPASPSISAVETPGGDQNVRLGREQIDAAVNNVNNLMRQAKIRPHFKDGKPDGLTLTRVRPDSIFTQLGLRSGDIITGVDGQDIQSVDDALRFYRSLKSADNVSVQIRRRGQQQTINYNID